jgi:hypothetical protein
MPPSTSAPISGRKKMANDTTIEVAFSDAMLQQLDHKAIVEVLRDAGVPISKDGRRVQGWLQWTAAHAHDDGLVAKWRTGAAESPMATPKGP